MMRLHLTSMANLSQFLVFVLFLSHVSSTSSIEKTQSYVVYMGSASEERSPQVILEFHQKMLSDIIPSEEKERAYLTQSYHHAFEGFSAMLTDKEAALLSDHERVVSIFPDRVLGLHTTRSWDFLQVQSGLRPDRLNLRATSDVIIGIVDTGIWPESPSFSDAGMRPVPSRWKGVCMDGPDFPKSLCNRKIIGARYYGPQPDSPRDNVNHGTHTASTAAGSTVANASYYGLAAGAAKGGSPSSRIAVYKACSLGGCASSAVLKAMDDAVGDGVDVISVSIGMSSVFQSDFLTDPIAIGALHADRKGVLVVCSGGNDGPDPFTVVNSAPWILTVAASSIDRTFRSDVVLGNHRTLQGVAINLSNHTNSTQYPVVLAADAATEYTPVSESSNCYPGSLDVRKAAGKIVVCGSTDPTVSRRVKKLVAQSVRARGVILIDDREKDVPFDAGDFPFTQVGNEDGAVILEHLNTTKKGATAAIIRARDVKDFRPAPVVASFSARGPGGLTEAILKPDVMAPGVGILAATIPSNDAGTVPAGEKPANFAIKSGTSMACPHVAGAAAFVKAAHPAWSPSMIRSALMTTATVSGNDGKPLMTSTGERASYHDMGAGEISPLRAMSPGLVFDTTADDYLHFLCYYGYKDQVIRKIAGSRSAFRCPAPAGKVPSPELISSINYPSIAVVRLDGRKGAAATVIGRTATNVGPHNSTYEAAIDAPKGVTVKVSPERLVFTGRWTKATYQISFQAAAAAGASKGYAYGTITWSDGAHSVRTVFATNVAVDS